LTFTLTAVADLFVVRSLQEVLFGFQSAMVHFCRLLPRRNLNNWGEAKGQANASHFLRQRVNFGGNARQS
jgi:hypothetical protein